MPMGIDYGLVLHGTLTQPDTGQLTNDANATEYSTYQYVQETAGTAPTVAADNIGRTIPSVPTMPLGGNNFGLHLIVTETYTTISSLVVSVLAGATSSPTTVLCDGPTYGLADLKAGSHHFLPMPITVAKYIRAKFYANTTTAVGKIYAYLGPNSDGATA